VNERSATINKRHPDFQNAPDPRSFLERAGHRSALYSVWGGVLTPHHPQSPQAGVNPTSADAVKRMIGKTIEELDKPPSEREAADGLATSSFRTPFFSHLTTAGREETLKSPAQRVTSGERMVT
jgi:hypothetical protein